MTNDLHERVAALLCAETHHCASKRGCGRKPCPYAITQHGAQAAAVIPMILEEAAKVADAAMRVHAMEVVQGRGGTDAGNPGAAIRAMGQPK